MYQSPKLPANAARNLLCEEISRVRRIPFIAQRPARNAQGFTLIELMIGIVVSLIGTLAMMAAFTVFESQKRTTTSGNDAQGNSSFSLYELEQQIRTAGSGLTQGLRYGAWGCTISAYSGGVQRLPAATAFPAPFSTWPTTVPAVPVLIQNGGTTGSDVIGVISGDSSLRTFKASVGTGSGLVVQLDNSLGIYQKDYALNVNPATGLCSLGLATAVVTTNTGVGNSLTLSPTDSPATGFNTAGYLFDMGPTPVFTLFGVDSTKNSLVAYDILQRGTAPVAAAPIADGIVMVKALYGIDSNASCPTQTSVIDTGATPGVIDTWTTASAPYDVATLTATSLAACDAMAKIKAIRVAVIAESELPERSSDYSTGGTPITLFADLPSAQQYSFTTNKQFRYKVSDTTIPIRNAFITKLF